MKKYFYNILLLFKNIKNYGFIEILKITLYELFYIIKFRDLNSLSYDDKNSGTYENVYKKNVYDTPYIPTPFYFLKIICLYLKKIKSNNFLILDLGCGYSRVQYFFSSYFNSFFFDVNLLKKVLKSLSNEFNFYCILINVKNTSFLLKKYKTLFVKKFKNPQRNIKIFKVKL